MDAYSQAELAQLTPLIGGVITAALHSPGPCGEPDSFGFAVRTRTGKTMNVWVDCDPEGNGPGHLNIEPE